MEKDNTNRNSALPNSIEEDENLESKKSLLNNNNQSNNDNNNMNDDSSNLRSSSHEEFEHGDNDNDQLLSKPHGIEEQGVKSTSSSLRSSLARRSIGSVTFGNSNSNNSNSNRPDEFPVTKREFTDPFCFIALLLTWCIGIGLGVYAVKNGGDPRLILYPTDYNGNKCGYDVSNITNETFPGQLTIVDLTLNGICTDSCSNETILKPSTKYELVCKHELHMPQSCNYMIKENDNFDPKILVACGGCMYQIASTKIFDRCIPVDLKKIFKEAGIPDITSWISELSPTLENFTNDLWMCKDIIMTYGFAGTSLLGFMMLYIIRNIPTLLLSFFLWSICLVAPIMFLIGGILCFLLDKDQSTTSTLKIIAYLMWITTFLLICVLIFIRKKLRLAIGITKIAATTLNDLPLSTYYPIIQMITYIIIVLPWIVIMLFLATCKPVEGPKLEQAPGVTNFVYSEGVKAGTLFLLFIFYWTSEFISAIGQITLSINFSKWYYTPREERTTNTTTNLINSACITICKHSGTAAYGSLIIALVRLFRSIFMTLHQKLKHSCGVNNKCIDVIFCCCSCCIFCVEKCLQYIEKNAYVQVAIFGFNFCKAAQESFFLIKRNASRIISVGLVSELIIVFCKLTIVSSISVSSFFTIQWLYGEIIFSSIGVTIFISIISWFIADNFLGVLSVAITTILQCLLIDEEMHPEGSIYAPTELNNFMDDVEVFHEEDDK